ncbi:MAG: M61 family metallopeptidase [Candidatus Eremiobacteraeota bacterium]|nr:M61 family metallopeptidase [Candidatus Eremiobacteraeota bacterium]MCW5870775.1 M61 family metallopeptidase [Candidatus Eremiobacteraeota bacterium]
MAQNHYVDVEARIPANSGDLELFLPVWTPGSYMVREYSRQIEGIQFSGADGKALQFEKTRKNRWLVRNVQGPVTAKYRVYCREMSVRNCWVENDFALLTGAQLFLAPVGQLQRPFQVQVDLPAGWKRVETGLAALGNNRFEADDFDELVDCPMVAGNPAVYDFTVSGVSHRLVNEGEGGIWDGPRSAKDAEKIVATVHKLWGDIPYAKYAPNTYTFFNMLTQAGGGLEHKNSTVLMNSRWGQRARQDYLHWLSLVAHEFFHAWNVKTLRPKALGPFDYENEVYTPSLWVAEGFTAYYDNLLVRRAGFSTHKEYLEAISKDIESLQLAPGRLVQPLRYSSYDAWIKYYRPDENSPNSGVSYYIKGSLVGLLLDARIRQASDGKRSLDDVMRRAYKLYSGTQGYTEEQFRAVAEEVAGTSLAGFFADTVDSAKELDYKPMLAYYGLRFKTPEVKKENKDPEAGWMGGAVAIQSGRLVVTSVRRGTPAYEAGLNTDDEILAVNDFRVLPDRVDRLEERLRQYSPGATVTLLVARREKLTRLSVRLAKKPSETWTLEVNPEADERARQHREAWLGPDLKS